MQTHSIKIFKLVCGDLMVGMNVIENKLGGVVDGRKPRIRVTRWMGIFKRKKIDLQPFWYQSWRRQCTNGRGPHKVEGHHKGAWRRAIGEKKTRKGLRNLNGRWIKQRKTY